MKRPLSALPEGKGAFGFFPPILLRPMAPGTAVPVFRP